MRYKVLIPAAGKGERAGLDFPKTLFPINNVPILVIIIRNVLWLDKQPVVIASPEGEKQIKEVLSQYELQAEIICQETPKGMGDAVLHFRNSVFFKDCENVLLIWGDMFSVKERTLRELLNLYEDKHADFVFPSVLKPHPYIYIERDDQGAIIGVKEQREGDIIPSFGETDTGVFLFNKQIVFPLMKDKAGNLKGRITREINFLPIISELVNMGFIVQGYRIATIAETIGFNAHSDIKAFRESTEFPKNALS